MAWKTHDDIIRYIKYRSMKTIISLEYNSDIVKILFTYNIMQETKNK